MTACSHRYRCLYCVYGGLDCVSTEPCAHHGIDGAPCRFKLNWKVIRMNVRDGAPKRHLAFLPKVIDALIDAGNDLDGLDPYYGGTYKKALRCWNRAKLRARAWVAGTQRVKL